jgi:phosphatidylglycerophosphatase A
MRKVIFVVTSLFGIGYVPVAPATVASAVMALLIYLLGAPSTTGFLVLLPILYVSGAALSGLAERDWGRDSGKIVIDEVLGFLVSIAFVSIGDFGGEGGGLILAFFMFRFFDIVKPFPVGWSQTLAGGWGVMTDDLLAGVYTNIFLRIFLWLFSST